jgi:hypothetical protein
MMEPDKLEQYFKIMRQYSVNEITVDGVNIKISNSTPESTQEVSKDPVPDDDELLFYSV